MVLTPISSWKAMPIRAFVSDLQSELASVNINMSIQLMDAASWQSYVMTIIKKMLCLRVIRVS